MVEAAHLLCGEASNKMRVIDTSVLRELKSAGVRPGLFTLEAKMTLENWVYRRDLLLRDSV